MKIAVCSDLHLEFGTLDLKNTCGADVLIMSGDILIADDLHSHPQPDVLPPMDKWGDRQASAYRYRDFLQRVSEEFKYVVAVAGNHEFYGGKWLASIQHLREEYSSYDNIKFLENDTFRVDDVTFIGGTLWTDLNNVDPLTSHAVKDMTNDYTQIRHDGQGYRRLRPEDTFSRHKSTLAYIKNVVAEKHDEKFVVVGHHSPSFKSTPPEYINDYLMNGAYCSDLSEFILDRPQIKLWTHGHIHDPMDYMIGDTRIVCNPRGYKGYETRANNFELFCVEI